VVTALEADDGAAAERALALFARGLRHHLRVEETFLFSEIDRVGDAEERALVARLRDAHYALEARVDLLAGRVGEGRGLGGELVGLRASIDEHEREEEHDLFPACDRRVTESLRLEALRAIERWPPST
jgi:hypothetical protein